VALQINGKSWLAWWSVWLLLSFGLLSCGAGNARIEEAVTARGVEADYRPVGVTELFGSGDPFYCAVRVANVPRGATVSARWYHGETFINETFYVTELEGSGWVGFQLTNSEPWPVGEYSVEVYFEDRLWETVRFHVR
jgi:hypothetical protein